MYTSTSPTPLKLSQKFYPTLPFNHINKLLVDAIAEAFEEFLRSFTDDEDSAPKYGTLSTEFVKSEGIILNVSIADIRIHNKILMDSSNSINYKEVYPVLCRLSSNVSKQGIQT